MVEKREAAFSGCDQFRYLLQIVWDDQRPLCQFIGLNPSTADEMKDDPTLRRCKAFARGWGCGGLMMTNLFAYRATSPAVMKTQPSPIGQDNDAWILWAASQAHLIICAWGNNGEFKGRDFQVLHLLESRFLNCLRLTGAGQPEHPLYIPAPTQPIRYIGKPR